MQLENSFQVSAPPEKVFAYLLDVNKVVGCVPGAELTEVVDSTTFKGKVKVKVGPITVAYSGTARISKSKARRARVRPCDSVLPFRSESRATLVRPRRRNPIQRGCVFWSWMTTR